MTVIIGFLDKKDFNCSKSSFEISFELKNFSIDESPSIKVSLLSASNPLKTLTWGLISKDKISLKEKIPLVALSISRFTILLLANTSLLPTLNKSNIHYYPINI